MVLAEEYTEFQPNLTRQNHTELKYLSSIYFSSLPKNQQNQRTKRRHRLKHPAVLTTFFVFLHTSNMNKCLAPRHQIKYYSILGLYWLFRSQECCEKSHIPQMLVQNNLYGMKIEIWVQSEKQKAFTKRGFKIWYGSKPKPIRVLNSQKIPATRNHRETQSGFLFNQTQH